MFKFKYRYCRARMVAFLNEELPPDSRRRVARYIDECPECYQEYICQRDLHKELKRQLPVLGRPRSAQTSRMWAAIQDEIGLSGTPRGYKCGGIRYGLAALALVIALCLPILLLGDEVAAAVTVTQPTPRDKPETATADAQIDSTQVAIVTLSIDSTGEMSTRNLHQIPQNTPQPGD